jgi:hypothetical protein
MPRRTFLPSPDPTEPRHDKFGIKETQGGYDWSERHMDPEYAAGLRGEYDSYEPPDDDGREYERPEMTFECRSCGERWTDDREDLYCPYCESSDYFVVEGKDERLDYCVVCGNVATETNPDGSFVCDEHWKGE